MIRLNDWQQYGIRAPFYAVRSWLRAQGVVDVTTDWTTLTSTWRVLPVRAWLPQRRKIRAWVARVQRAR
jgi:hypothetical protein